MHITKSITVIIQALKAVRAALEEPPPCTLGSQAPPFSHNVCMNLARPNPTHRMSISLSSGALYSPHKSREQDSLATWAPAPPQTLPSCNHQHFLVCHKFLTKNCYHQAKVLVQYLEQIANTSGVKLNLKLSRGI